VRTNPAQQFLVSCGKFLQCFFAELGQSEIYLTAVGSTIFSYNSATGNQPINQTHRAVMPHLQALGQFPDGHVALCGKTLDGKQGLVLLGRDTCADRCIFAEPHKLPQRITQICQSLIFCPGDFHNLCAPHLSGATTNFLLLST